MAVPARDAQILERELQVCRRAPESKPASSGNLMSLCRCGMGNKQEELDLHACRAVILLAFWRHARMVPVAGALEWKDVGSSGSAGGGNEEEVLVASWSAESSAWGLMRSWLRIYGTGLKGGQGQVIFLPWSSLTSVPAPLPELQKGKAIIGKEPPAVGDEFENI